MLLFVLCLMLLPWTILSQTETAVSPRGDAVSKMLELDLAKWLELGLQMNKRGKIGRASVKAARVPRGLKWKSGATWRKFSFPKRVRISRFCFPIPT